VRPPPQDNLTAPATFVAAESVLFDRGQVAVAAIRQPDGERLRERTPSFDGQPDCDKYLARNRRDAEVADAERLEDERHSFG